MFSSKPFAATLILFNLIILMIMLSGCDGDLNPSGIDKTETVIPGSSGTHVSQVALDFTLPATDNIPVNLATEYSASSAVVLYFTMWCPVCDSHMSYIRQYIVPSYPNVSFYMVDYVSGSVALAAQAQQANGYNNMDVLVDVDYQVQKDYRATMATTVVIDNGGIVLMNEDFKDGARLLDILASLP